MDARKELQNFKLQQLEHGAKSGELCRVLFHKGYTEAEVGKVMCVDPKTAHAAKIDFSVAGKAKAEKTGKRVHLDFSKAQLKRINGKKQLTRFLELVDKVLAKSEKVKGE